MTSSRDSHSDKRPGARWLVIIVLVFCISVVISMVQLRTTVKLLDYRPGTSIWALFQLKNEYRNLRSKLLMYQHGLVSHDALMMSYDILWSRFPVLQEGLDANQIRALEGGSELLTVAFENLKNMDAQIQNLVPGDAVSSTRLRDQLEGFSLKIDDMALSNFHHNNQYFRKNDQRMRSLQMQLGYLLLGILLSGSFLLWMLFRENRHNRYQALHDSLTDMPNRKLLRQHMNQLAASGKPFALHLLDLNGFKEVNDTLGHQSGDELLRAVAKRLLRSMAESRNFMVARLGGDEFAVVQYPLTGKREAEEVAGMILKALTPAFDLDGNLSFVGTSIGTALYPEHASQVRDLLSRADLAMYQAKKHSPASAFCFFEEAFNDRLKRRQMLHRDLRDALQAPLGQLRLEYQPLVDLQTETVSSLEALLRWDHPSLGAIPPMEAIEVAEQYGLGQQLGSWVLREACRQNRSWQDEGEAPVRIAVNISPSMYQLDLVETVRQALQRAELPAACLTIEVTEDTTIKLLHESMGVLPGLRKLGVTIALDDFGTGLSSLSHLKELPVQVLKIDRSFVKDLASPECCSKLVGGIIQLGHTLNMHVVAEGIEDCEIRDVLRQYGCDIGQGYYYSRPLKADMVPAVLARLGLKTLMVTQAELEPE